MRYGHLTMKHWEVIVDKLSNAGWSLGWVSAIDSNGRTLWIVDAHRDNGKRFVVRSDEMLMRSRAAREVLGNHRRQTPVKPAGVWAGSQPLIPKGKRSGLLTHIEARSSSTNVHRSQFCT
jgi:hypothetical protein